MLEGSSYTPEWKKAWETMETLNEKVVKRAEDVLKKSWAIWYSKKVGEFNSKFKGFPDGFIEKHLVIHVLRGSSVRKQEDSPEIKDFSGEYSVKGFYEGLLKELDEKEKQVVRRGKKSKKGRLDRPARKMVRGVLDRGKEALR
ncbi:MAG: hypothetical protein OEL89_03265 [Candidatus Peregrinibacteria bacterium]|nr:hypothetical protein [Candidatus Peregrinibacteria bacterium]